MKRISLLFCMLPGLLLLANWAAAAPPLKITLSNDEWPPYLGEQLPDHGVLSRIVKEAFARADVQVSYRFYPNNRALWSAQMGVVSGSLGWAPSEERMKTLLYTEPVLQARMVFFERKNDAHHWGALKDLQGLRIGITIGNYYSDEFDKLSKAGVLTIDGASADDLNLRKLLARRIDLFPIDDEVGHFLLAKDFSAVERAALAPQSKSFWSAPLCVVIWRKDPHAQELVERFNRGLKTLHDSGDFERILNETRQRILQKVGQGH